MGSGILRAIGDSRRPLFFLVAACMTNIVLDVITVIGMDMGVRGAAWATILSQTVAAILVLITLIRSHTSYHLNPRKIRLHRKILTLLFGPEEELAILVPGRSVKDIEIKEEKDHEQD